MECHEKESHIEEIEKKIISVFKNFDYENNNSIDIREVGTILRALGCCPSEADIKVIIEESQDEEHVSYIHLDKFLPIATKILEDGRHPPATYDKLLEACSVLDTEKTGHLTWDALQGFLTTYGEPFNDKELEDLAAVVVNKNTKQIDYRDWLTWLVSDE